MDKIRVVGGRPLEGTVRLSGAKNASLPDVCAAILTVPNFFANKIYVWKDTSRDNLRTQVIVFWVAARLGVTMATLLTFLVLFIVGTVLVARRDA